MNLIKELLKEAKRKFKFEKFFLFQILMESYEEMCDMIVDLGLGIEFEERIEKRMKKIANEIT